MARLAGRNLQDNHRIEYALTRIFGIGWKLAGDILEITKIDSHQKVQDLSEEDLRTLQDLVIKYKVEGDLKEELNSHEKRLREIGTNRGKRLANGLPVRGQRTRSNARTNRGKRKTVGSLKKH